MPTAGIARGWQEMSHSVVAGQEDALLAPGEIILLHSSIG